MSMIELIATAASGAAIVVAITAIRTSGQPAAGRKCGMALRSHTPMIAARRWGVLILHRAECYHCATTGIWRLRQSNAHRDCDEMAEG